LQAFSLLLGLEARAQDAVWLVGGKQRGETTHAVAVVRANLALKAARKAFANSRFEVCIAQTATAEAGLARAIRRPADLERLRTLNLWLGLCHAASGGSAVAKAVFARAARLPGPKPDPSLFAPQVMQLYRSAEGEARGRTCGLHLSGKAVELDGRRVESGSQIARGEHYVTCDGDGGARFSARIPVGQSCSLQLSQATEAPPALSAAEAGDRSFLIRVGREAGVRRIVIAHGAGPNVRISVFDVTGGKYLRNAQRLDSNLWGKETAPCEEPKVDGGAGGGSPWYRRWWVWALVGAGVATAVVVPVVISTSGETRYKLSF